MHAVGPAEIRRILAVTDAHGIHRESVRIPLAARPGGGVRVTPAAQVEIVVDADAEFEAWIGALPGVLSALDLRAVRRA